MVSVPLDLELPVNATLEALLSTELGPYDPTRWRSYRYIPADKAYVEPTSALAGEGALRPEPGRGFWLIARNAYRIDTAPVSGRSTPTDVPNRITLQPGWNQIGNPFVFPVAWCGVQIVGPADSVEAPVAWDEAGGVYDTSDVRILLPFEGYWVRNRSSRSLEILIPPDEALGANAVSPCTAPAEPSHAEPDHASWRVRIEARCEGARDLANFIGVDRNAREGRDALDRSEPPMVPGPALSLCFLDPAPQRSYAGSGLTSDIRTPIDLEGIPASQGRRWVFDVARNGDGDSPPEVRLDFSGMDRVPGELEMLLIDRELGREIDLRQQATYRFVAHSATAGAQNAPSPTQARFELLAGTPAFVGTTPTVLKTGPHVTRLLPNYPNPVAAWSVIRFEMARMGRAKLEVFDLAGRRVETLLDEDRPAGVNEFAWRAADLAPGVYALRLGTPDRIDVRKLVKVH